MSEPFDPYYTWLAIPPEEQPPDHYRLLGVRRYESNGEVIVNAADQRMAYLRTFQAGKRGALSQKLLNEVASAQVCLLDPAKKRAYDERLSREAAERESPLAPQPIAPVALPRAKTIPPQPLSSGLEQVLPVVPLTLPAWPLQPPPKPPIQPQVAWPPSPMVLAITACSTAALVLLVIVGVIWANWPRGDVPDPGPTPVPMLAAESDSMGPVTSASTADPDRSVTQAHPPAAESPSAVEGRPPQVSTTPATTAQPSPPLTAANLRGPPPPRADVPLTAEQPGELQRAWAAHLSLPVEVSNSLGMKLRLIPPGKFVMGATSPRSARSQFSEPPHEATVATPFYIGACEVTVGQFRAFVNDSGYRTTAERTGAGVTVWARGRSTTNTDWTWSNLPYPIGDDHPVGGLSWDDAVAFCQWLSDKEGMTYRLPDETEWEFACRGGSGGAWHWGDDEQVIKQYAWIFPTVGSRPVATKLPNPFGLFDMHGSATEWCADRLGSATGDAEQRSVRGGSINTESNWTECGCRRGQARTSATNAVGFRVARVVPGQERRPATIADASATPSAASASPAPLTDEAKAKADASSVSADLPPPLDPASVRSLTKIGRREGPLWARFAAEGKYLALGAEGASMAISFSTEPATLPRLSPHPRVFAYGDDGSILASAMQPPGQDSLVFLRRGPETARVTSSPFRYRGQIRALVFSPDRRILFVAGDGEPRLAALNVLKNLEPIQGFRTRLSEVDWMDAQGDLLVVKSPQGDVEAHSVRTRNLVLSLKVPCFAGSPAALRESPGQRISLITFAAEQILEQQLTGSRTLDRFPFPGQSQAENLLAVSSAGDWVVIGGDAGLVIWDLRQNKAATRIVATSGQQFCAIHSQPPLVALAAPDDIVMLCNLDSLLARPLWRMPSGQNWVAPYPKPRAIALPAEIVLPRGIGPPGATAGLPSSAAPSGPSRPPVDEAAGRAAIAALRTKGLELSDDPATAYSVQAQGLALDAEVGRLLSQLPAIQHLNFDRCTGVGEVLLRLGRLPDLGGLRLQRSDMTDEHMTRLAKWPTLKHLDLQGTKITATGLVHLSHLDQLRSLDLPGGLDRQAIVSLSSLKQLEYVNNWPSGTTDDDLALVGKMTGLKILELGNSAVTGDGLAHLRNLTGLERLTLPAQTSLASLVHLKALNLKSIHLPQGCGDREMAHLTHMTNLEMFTVPPDVTDEGLRTLARLPGLKTLYMSGNEKITAGGLKSLAEMPGLQDVHLPRSTTDEGLRVLSGCKSLRNVSIQDAAITDDGLAILAALPALESVYLSGRVSDAGLVRLQKIPGLKSVGLSGANITAKGYTILRNYSGLETLNLVQMKLTDEDVAAMTKLTHIKRLMLQQCGPTDEQVQTLKRALPNCQVSSW